jgi:hypothetical protein
MAGYLLLLSVADTNRSLLPQLEVGALLFAVAGLGFRIATAPQLSSTFVPSTPSSPVLLPIMWSLAIVLY